MENASLASTLPLALFAWAIMTGAASAAPLAATEFTGRTVSGKTASNISWATSGVVNPGNLT